MLSIIACQIIRNHPNQMIICFSNAKGRLVKLGLRGRLGWIWLEKVAGFGTVQNAWHMNRTGGLLVNLLVVRVTEFAAVPN